MSSDRPRNPWLPAPDPGLAPPPDAEARRLEPLPPLVRPQAGLAAEPAPDGLAFHAVRRGTANPPWWWVGCHGGAGVSTLSGMVPGGRDAEREWPMPVDGHFSRVVLVARTNAPGLRAAQAAARQWASGRVPGVTLLGLVAVADAPGRMPRALNELLRLVGGGVPKVWQVPWIDALRFDKPLPDRLPRGLLKLAAELGPLQVEAGHYRLL